jgi:hypothetical protein
MSFAKILATAQPTLCTNDTIHNNERAGYLAPVRVAGLPLHLECHNNPQLSSLHDTFPLFTSVTLDI